MISLSLLQGYIYTHIYIYISPPLSISSLYYHYPSWTVRSLTPPCPPPPYTTTTSAGHSALLPPPWHTLSAGARSAPCTQRLEQREAHDAYDIASTKRQYAQVIGGAASVGARARSAHRRRARSAKRQPGCRRRMGVARRATRRWQPAADPPSAQAAAPSQRYPGAERERECGDS